MPRILCDFHHTGLFSSLIRLFENRLGFQIFRPIGLEWYTEGFWNVWPHIDTANQYLSLDQSFKPSDGTPPLNRKNKLYGFGVYPEGMYEVQNPEYPELPHMACTLDWFKDNEFDYVLASIPQHIPMYKELIRRYQPKAKFIYQVGNNWSFADVEANVLASTMPRPTPEELNVVFYHQEFDLMYYNCAQRQVDEAHKISSYTNVMQGIPEVEFLDLESRLKYCADFYMRGAQNRDGNVDGAEALSRSMLSDSLIFHSKPGGDGFGHILHSAYACGAPVIAHSSHYRGQLGSLLLQPGTYIDMDNKKPQELADEVVDVLNDPDLLEEMSDKTSRRFYEVVNFNEDEANIREWLERAI